MNEVNGVSDVNDTNKANKANEATVVNKAKEANEINGTIKQLIGQWHQESSEPVCAYVYDLRGIRQHVRTMLSTMPQCTSLFYAIKANPDKRIIKALLPLVKGFEVASVGELAKVREVSADVPVLFGGPGKKESELAGAIRMNVSYIHVESLLELRKIAMLSKQMDKTVSILLRINLRTSTLPKTHITMGGRPSPFGLDEELVEEAVTIIREEGAGRVDLCGFHFHSLSNNTQAELHAEMVQLYIRRAEQWQQEYGLDVRIVNAGGGFGVTYDGSPGFDWERFTSLLAQSGAVQSLGSKQLWFEPGRFIVADYGYYAAEVVDIKQSHKEWFAVIRGGTHHNRLPASWGHDHPFYIVSAERWPYPFERPELSGSSVTIAGELCTPKDRLYTNAAVERLCVGDVIVFVKSGAYCWTISHHDFLGHPHPQFHYITEEGEHNEPINDVFHAQHG